MKGEEEAYLNFILNGFKEIVAKYGAPKVLAELDEQTVWELDKTLTATKFKPGGMWNPNQHE